MKIFSILFLVMVLLVAAVFAFPAATPVRADRAAANTAAAVSANYNHATVSATRPLSKSGLAAIVLTLLGIAGFSFARHHNIGAYIKVYRGAANTSAVAAGSGDNSAVTGSIIDRQDAAFAKSAVFAVPFTATLAAGKSLFLKSVIVEHGDDSGLSDAATLQTLEDSTGTAVATSAGGGTVVGCKNYDVDLSGAKRYVRLKFTPDLDASGTDTAALSAVVVLGGADTIPV